MSTHASTSTTPRNFSEKWTIGRSISGGQGGEGRKENKRYKFQVARSNHQRAQQGFQDCRTSGGRLLQSKTWRNYGHPFGAPVSWSPAVLCRFCLRPPRS